MESMGGTHVGAERTAATRIGISVEEYRERRAAGLKWCHRCKDWHALNRFGRDASRSDGLTASCLRSKRQPAGDSPSIADRRNMAAMGLAWCKECRWWLPIADVPRPRASLCRPHLRDAERRYSAANPNRRQRATGKRMRGIPNWWRQERLAEGCAYCDAPAIGLDHFIPVSKGGESTPGNLVPACKSCNSSKRDQDPALWVSRLNPIHWDRLIEQHWVHDGALVDVLGLAA
jgi:5-methylcytosine-specific restriction endonuclease McrA